LISGPSRGWRSPSAPRGTAPTTKTRPRGCRAAVTLARRLVVAIVVAGVGAAERLATPCLRFPGGWGALTVTVGRGRSTGSLWRALCRWAPEGEIWGCEVEVSNTAMIYLPVK